MDIQNSLKEDYFQAKGRKEASQGMLTYKEARLRRVERLYTTHSASASELEFARADRAATVSLIGWMQGEEESNEGRLKLLAYLAKPKEEIDPKVVAEMSKAVEDARCRKAVHRRDHFAAYADYYTREGKRNEILLRKGAISIEDFQLNDSRRLENRALEKAWVEFLKGCPSGNS